MILSVLGVGFLLFLGVDLVLLARRRALMGRQRLRTQWAALILGLAYAIIAMASTAALVVTIIGLVQAQPMSVQYVFVVIRGAWPWFILIVSAGGLGYVRLQVFKLSLSTSGDWYENE